MKPRNANTFESMYWFYWKWGPELKIKIQCRRKHSNVTPLIMVPTPHYIAQTLSFNAFYAMIWIKNKLMSNTRKLPKILWLKREEIGCVEIFIVFLGLYFIFDLNCRNIWYLAHFISFIVEIYYYRLLNILILMTIGVQLLNWMKKSTWVCASHLLRFVTIMPHYTTWS